MTTSMPRYRDRDGSRIAGLYVVVLLALATAACSDRTPTGIAPAQPSQAPPVDIRGSSGGTFVPGQILVAFEDGTDDAQTAAILMAHGASFGRALAAARSGRPLANIVSVQSGREVATANALAKIPGVAFAEPDWIRSIAPVANCDPCLTPNDPSFGLKWDLHNDGTLSGFFGGQATEDADMDWLEAFDHLGPEFVGEALIGIIDTGIRSTHEDICGKVIGGHNFITGQPDGEDDHGHGSHVAGIAAGCGNNGVGVSGVAYGPNVRLLAAKVCDAAGNCSSSAIAEAMTWVADQGADVLNLSLGDPVFSATEHAALQYAVSQGVLPVCAAGNDGTPSILFPAANPECVAVTATNWNDGLASYSSFGQEAEVAAPGGDGEDILGSSFILSLGAGGDADYTINAGTSMASPQVAGLAGLLFALGIPTAADVRTRIQTSADDLGTPGWDQRFGHGRINIFNAVADLTPPPPPPNDTPIPSFSVTPTSPQPNETVILDGSASVDPDGSIVDWSWDFGDGSPAGSGDIVEHAYTSTGAYTVTLTVTDDRGLAAGTSQNVMVATGAGSLVTPTLRLDAGSLGLTNGASVGTWTDPATGRTASAPGASAEGTYLAGETPSGTPVVHFQGNDHYEVPDEVALEMDGSSTVLAVYSADVSGQQMFVAKHSDGGTAGAYGAGLTTGGAHLLDRPWKETGPRGTTSIGTGTFHVVTYRISSGNVAFRVDGVPAGGGSIGAGTPSNQPLRIGMLRHRSPVVDEYFLRGKLADLLVFDRALGDQDLAAWEAELQSIHLVDNNVAPTAAMTVTPPDPQPNETVFFDGSSSSDPDGTVASWSWDLGDASGLRSGMVVEHTFAAAGTYDVTLTVTDNKGATDVLVQSVVVGPTAGTLQTPKLRLDAAAVGLADGSRVNAWPDPGTGRTATAPTASAEALFLTNQTPGGTPAVHFQGDDHYEVPDEDALDLHESSTLVVVYAPDVITQQAFLAKHSDGGTAGALLAAFASDGRAFIDRPWKETGPRASSAIGAGAFQIVSYRIASGRVEFRIDGAPAGSGTIGNGTATDRPLRIGMIRHRSPAVDEYFLQGRVADLLVFDRSLGDQDLAAWEDQLRAVHIDGTPPPNVAPTAAFGYLPAAPETGEVVSFDGTGSSDSDGTVVGWSWDWGDATTAGSGSTPTHAYAAAGSYTVTLTVTDDDGATDQTNQLVSVTDPPPPPNVAPTASFGYLPAAPETGELVSFDGSGSSDSDGSVVGWSWDWGDATTAGAGATPTHSYGAAGDYTVTLTVTDDDGATDQTSQVVSVSDPPPPP
ncbi:MAG: PKD domain-containing protein, partial [Gemmatimonadota bacterium]